LGGLRFRSQNENRHENRDNQDDCDETSGPRPPPVAPYIFGSRDHAQTVAPSADSPRPLGSGGPKPKSRSPPKDLRRPAADAALVTEAADAADALAAAEADLAAAAAVAEAEAVLTSTLAKLAATGALTVAAVEATADSASAAPAQGPMLSGLPLAMPTTVPPLPPIPPSGAFPPYSPQGQAAAAAWAATLQTCDPNYGTPDDRAYQVRVAGQPERRVYGGDGSSQ
jgi:hypothetical protein